MAVAESNMAFANKFVKVSAIFLALVILTSLFSEMATRWSEPGSYWIPIKIIPFFFFVYLSFKKLGRGVLINVFLLWLNIFVSMGFIFKYYIWLSL
jgi:hypothetical protein